MFCRNCGKELPENAYVCIGCGCLAESKPVQPTRKIENRNNFENITEKKSKNGLLLKIFLMVSFALACLALGALIMSVFFGQVEIRGIYRRMSYGEIYYNYGNIYFEISWIILSYIFAFISMGSGIFVLILGLREKEELKLIAILDFILSVSMFIITVIPFAYYMF